MSARRSPVLRASLTVLLSALAATAVLVPALHRAEPPRLALTAASTNPVTPGDFRGYGFDQCTAPSQGAMDAWMRTSPFLAVGIYISGNSRACRSQPNLTAGWVHAQLANGWKLLPITLGPQASCNPRYPRYSPSIDPTIDPRPGSKGVYAAARSQARAEAAKTASRAAALGIAKGSTLWYDLESFDISKRDCRESALAFLSAYTVTLHHDGYVSGVYSSAGSGVLMLDDVRRNRPSAYVLPDRIWIARWDGNANTSTTYISDTGWNPGRRVKQYEGGHVESWGGVRIDIDRDYVNLGRGSYARPQRPCGGITLDFPTYPVLDPASPAAHPAVVKALQCMLHARGYYSGKLTSRYDKATVAAVRHWKSARGLNAAGSGQLGKNGWVAFLSAGTTPTLKVGSSGLAVYRLQRAYDAAFPRRRLPITGVYDGATAKVTKVYQSDRGLRATGIVTGGTWNLLRLGRA